MRHINVDSGTDEHITLQTGDAYKVSAVFRNNAPTVYGVFDVSDKSQGFNGRLVSEHETLEAAQTDATALNSVQS
jgi:hypothetical protein